MARVKRGPDRRHAEAYVERTAGGPDTADAKRRVNPDRRRNGFISQLDLCRGMDYDHLEKILERCPIQKMSPGDVLLEPGQANHHLYFLLSGRLEIRLKSAESPVADIIEVGECIGEMSIIDGQPASAHISASEPSRVLAVHENIFWSQIATSAKAVLNLSRVLAQRMRKRNDVTLRALEHEMRLEQLQKELSAASEIQAGMLPHGPKLLAKCKAVDVHARIDFVTSVGGDFYDAFELNDARICIAIGDVSGKGIPAALFMVRTITMLRAELNNSTDLTKCIGRLNAGLCDINITHMFVSLIVMIVDTTNGNVEFVNAGHPPLLASLSGKPFMKIEEPIGLIAGVLNDYKYDVGKIQMQAGDQLILYTDGVIEARNNARSFYSLPRFIRLSDKHKNDQASTIIDSTFKALKRYCHGMPQADDITVVAVKYIGN